MYRNEVAQRKEPREMFTSNRGLMEFGSRVLAADPSRGWLGAVGQGAQGTMQLFDKHATEDMTDRQAAQKLATAIKKHVDNFGEVQRHHRATESYRERALEREDWVVVGETSTGQPALMNKRSGELLNGITREPLPPEERMALSRGRGAAGGPTANMIMRQNAANLLAGGDEKMAAAILLGQLRPGDLEYKARRAADAQWDNKFPKPKGVTEAEWKRDFANDLIRSSKGAVGVGSGAPAGDGSAPKEGDMKMFKEGPGIFKDGEWRPYKP
jgi:hypothetical protein